MIASLFKYISQSWPGPAITVRVGKRLYRIGQGQAVATVVFRRADKLWQFFLRPSLTFGEGYMRGDIAIEGELLDVLRGFQQSRDFTPRWLKEINKVTRKWPVSIQKAVRNVRHHYDIGNDFYQLWLDPSQTYTCAYFPKGTETLEEAQYKKRELVCRKLRLERGQTLLDIGCGWGSLLFHAAQNYGVKVVGVTPAKEQVAYIIKEARRRKLEGQVTVVPREWRQISGRFDRIASIGMFEQVPLQQHRYFFKQWRSLLAPDGISVLHTIGNRLYPTSNPWLNRYIFPGGVLPTHALISEQVMAAGLRLYRSENLKPHYAKTLAEWARNFTAVRARVVDMFDEPFARMWWLYLQACEAGFRWGDLELWQFELYGPKAKLPLSRDI